MTQSIHWSVLEDNHISPIDEDDAVPSAIRNFEGTQRVMPIQAMQNESEFVNENDAKIDDILNES